jgi:hypothetical protein
MWKGFLHCSSFMMLQHELLGMHITLTRKLVLIYCPNWVSRFKLITPTGFFVLIYYPYWVTGLVAFHLTLKNTRCFRQKQQFYPNWVFLFWFITPTGFLVLIYYPNWVSDASHLFFSVLAWIPCQVALARFRLVRTASVGTTVCIPRNSLEAHFIPVW